MVKNQNKEKTMKKLLTSILVVVLLLSSAFVIFAACGDNRDNDHTIVFYTQQNDDLQKVTAVAIAKFEAKYPGWKVDHQVQSGGYDGIRTKIVNNLGSKKQPDLAYCYADHVALYMQKKKVIDINTLINSTATVEGKTIQANAEGKWEATGDATYAVGYTETEMANFVPAFLAEGKGSNFTGAGKYGYSDDAMLTMPFLKSTEVMFYNQTALQYIVDQLKSANRTEALALFVDAEGKLTPPATWDVMWKQAPIVAEFFPEATLLGYDSEANWFITESERQGWGYTSVDEKNHYLFNNQRAVAWLDQLSKFNEDGHITTQQMSGGSYTSNLFKQGVGAPVDKGTGGGVIYCVGSTGGAKNQATNNFTWKVTRVPGSVKPDGTIANQVISQGPSLVMFRSDKAKNADEKAMMTFLFMKELYDPTIQAGIAKLQGYTPCILNAAQVDEDFAEYLKGTDITAQAINLANKLASEGLFFSSPAFVGSSDARTQVGNALQAVLQGTKSGEEALRVAEKNCP